MTGRAAATAGAAAPRWRPPSIFGGPNARRVAWALALAYVAWSVSDLAVDWARVDRLRHLGGVRIEDNVLVTADEPEVLTAEIPKHP